MPRQFVTPTRQESLTILAVTVSVVALVSGLYWAQAIFIPVTLAILISFPLSPIVAALERLRVGRTYAVIAVILLSAILLGSVAKLVNDQVTGLLREIPTYSENIKVKVDNLREMVPSGSFEDYSKLTRDIADAWTATPSEVDDGPDSVATSAVAPEPQETLETETETKAETETETNNDKDKTESAPKAESETTKWTSWMLGLFSPMLASFRHVAMALVLVVFILLEREGLANRLIRLLGSNHLAATTKALVDAGSRISRFLFAQLALNCAFGIIWGTSLYFFGLDYALLWGFLAAILRYIPFIGATLAALMPIALSLAQFPGWWQPLSIIVLLLIMELVTNNVMEPWLYGRSIGVSPLAMVVSAAFWTFLWGPIGLVLSGPLTVCLVVIGKHAPGFKSIDVLLGDIPELEKDDVYYQRLLSHRKDSAANWVREQIDLSGTEAIYDQLLIPTLVNTKRDREREIVTPEDEAYILQATKELLESLEEERLRADSDELGDVLLDPRQGPKIALPIVACPPHVQAGMLAITMFHQLLDPLEWKLEPTGPDLLTGEIVELVTATQPAIICIAALPPNDLLHASRLCGMIRAKAPKTKIIVGRWGLTEDIDENQEQLKEAGAHMMAITLLETQDRLSDLRPNLLAELSTTARAPAQNVPASDTADSASF